jgi:hypothetical protein
MKATAIATLTAVSRIVRLADDSPWFGAVFALPAPKD